MYEDTLNKLRVIFKRSESEPTLSRFLERELLRIAETFYLENVVVERSNDPLDLAYSEYPLQLSRRSVGQMSQL